MALNEEKYEPIYIRHARCGGEYRTYSPEEIVPDGADCMICAEIRERYQASYGLNNTATAGTPLAAELGLVVVVDKIGPVAS